MKKAFIPILMVSFISVLFFGCSKNEESARKMLDKVLALQQAGKYDEANQTIQNIIQKYPETEIAAELRDIVLPNKEETKRFNTPPEGAQKAPAPFSQEQKNPPPTRPSLAGVEGSKTPGIRDQAVDFFKKILAKIG